MFRWFCRKRRTEVAVVHSLFESHERIRTVVDLAVSVGERTTISMAEISDGATRVEQYFANVYPMHVKDEEESILPRLHHRSSRLDSALYQMHEQHEVYEDMIRRVCAHAYALRVDPRAGETRDALACVARPLRSLLQEHLAVEESVIFPALREHLSPTDEAVVRREMAERRQPSA